MSNITIVGGHGKVALLLAPILRGRGDHATSLIRNPQHADDVEKASAAPHLADIEKLSTEEIAGLLFGQDAVIWSAGAGGGSAERTYAVDRDAAIRTIDAAQQAGVKRFVMVSYMGAGPNHGVPESDSFFAYAQAKTEADEYLSSTDLDWTILHPGLLTMGDATGTIQIVDGKHFGDYPVSRANVALTTAAILHDDATIGRTIEFGDGPVPIADALAQ
ncbi:MAG TPA: SDR family oxidoreductase [Actinomycetaceae bacterium]|nr:SDR family oxidoreductase [Actinomycetaceae bacterium]